MDAKIELLKSEKEKKKKQRQMEIKKKDMISKLRKLKQEVESTDLKTREGIKTFNEKSNEFKDFIKSKNDYVNISSKFSEKLLEQKKELTQENTLPEEDLEKSIQKAEVIKKQLLEEINKLIKELQNDTLDLDLNARSIALLKIPVTQGGGAGSTNELRKIIEGIKKGEKDAFLSDLVNISNESSTDSNVLVQKPGQNKTLYKPTALDPSGGDISSPHESEQSIKDNLIALFTKIHPSSIEGLAISVIKGNADFNKYINLLTDIRKN